jgi:cytochrome P450
MSALVGGARRVAMEWLLRLPSRWRGFSLLDLLPDSTLLPLRRDGVDPVPELARVREAEPVHRLKAPFGIRAWLVSGYPECKEVLGRAGATFSNDFRHVSGIAGVGRVENPGGLGFSDPPQHTRLRTLLTPEFTARRLRRLAPQIDTIVSGQLDHMAALGQAGEPVDVLEHFALPVPALTICALLGIPYEDRQWFQRLSTARFDFRGGPGSSLGAISESLTYLRGVVEKQRLAPGPGLLGALITNHGDELSDEELAGLADGLLTGGLETTASMLALGTLVLLQNPKVLATLREDDGAIGPVVEELLRYLSVVQVAFPRFAREDVTVAGTAIKAGDIVLCSLPAANRDARNGLDLESFDPRRPVPTHLAFGHGIHRCVGAELARMELRSAYSALAWRFPGLRLATAPERLAYRELSFVYGIQALPVRLH